MANLAEHEVELKAGLTNWQDFANCEGADSDIFFPGKGGSNKQAKKICRGCVVREECLTYALDHNEKHGIWGGMSERERRRINRQRALELATATTAA